MAALNDLINQITDTELRDRIQREVDKLAKQKKFGLVFEEHLPECTPLYEMPVKAGCQVMLRDSKEDKAVYTVLKLEDGQVTCVRNGNKENPVNFPIGDIMRVTEFGEPIYPYLKPLDTVCNASDSNLWHTLIEADNYHALQLLEYLYAGKVDCIYIDPPYNTGAKDWKYNNDYVDGNDNYRHSKWLSMMEKRLKLAKRLLNLQNSILIITIDEKEYLHLGCLLEELFPEARMQMISTVINPSGSSRKDLFSRSDEYIFFIFFGAAHVNRTENDMLHVVEKKSVRWDGLVRHGANGRRSAHPNLFYPVFFKEDDGHFEGVGEALDANENRESISVPEGCFPVFPLTSNGEEARWGIQPKTFIEKYEKGYIKFGPWKKGDRVRSISHLQDGTVAAIENGDIEVYGKDQEGTLILGESHKAVTPMTTWVQSLHSAGDYGSSFLKKIFPVSRFNFPKSIYAVKDTINFAVKENKNALILDFFAGSGTTLHAVNLLNAEDGGHRQCIMVTNNEVSDAETKELSAKGYQPGDEEWNKLGIARYVTWPRTVCSIEGHDINGNPLKGNYLGSERSMADGFKANAAFFQLGFLDKTAVALGMQFKEMLPLLWMKAGAIGPCPSLNGQDIPDMLILPENKFAVLVNENAFASFEQRLEEHPEIQTVYLITDYEVNYRSMKKSLNVETTYQLYRDYLDNFRINRGRN